MTTNDRTESFEATLRAARPTAHGLAHAEAYQEFRAQLFGDRKRTPRLGRYLLGPRIGAGGLGVVFKAYDPELDRAVAVKILRSEGASLDRQRRGTPRMLREANLLARLSDPHIVPVFDVGTYVGEPVRSAEGRRDGNVFIVMQYIQGQDLGRWLHSERSWPEIRDAFRAAGLGLAAAHRQGVIHRDFKPGNVLIADSGEVKVADFGLARAMDVSDDDTRTQAAQREPQLRPETITRSGTIAGTPPYMAPEQQSRGETDARTDQFSFCVALFEAVCGRAPFPTVDNLARLDAIEQGPTYCPKIEVPERVWSVLRRGLAFAPQHRFTSMDALLYALDGGRRSKRRAVGLMVAAGGLLGATAWWTEPQVANRCASAAAELAAVSGPARMKQVRQAILSTGVRYGEATWLEVDVRLRQYGEAWSRAHADACETMRTDTHPSGIADLRMACLEARRTEAAALVDVLASADERVVERAVTAVASLVPVDECADAAALRRRSPLPSDPSLAALAESSRRMLARARALELSGHYPEALVAAYAAWPQAEATDHPPTILRSRMLLGRTHMSSGQSDAAQGHLEEAAWLAMEAGQDAVVTGAAARLMRLASQSGRADQAERWRQHGEAAIRRGELGVRVRARWANSLGRLMLSRGRYGAALEEFDRAVRLFGDAPDDTAGNAAVALNNAAVALHRLDRVDEAKHRIERAIELRTKAWGPHHPMLAAWLDNLAALCIAQRDFAGAQRYSDQAVQMFRSSLGLDHYRAAATLMNRGLLRMNLGDGGGAIADLQRTAAIYQSARGAHHALVGHAQANLGAALFVAEDLDGALSSIENAIPKLDAGSAQLHFALLVRGRTHLELRHRDRARADAQRAVALAQSAEGVGTERLARSLSLLGAIDLDDGASGDAAARFETALELAGESPDPALHAEIRFGLARALWPTASFRARALALAREAHSDYAKAGPVANREARRVRQWLAIRTD